ncbi:MCE-family protein mce2B [Mycobacterium tuberculosis RGTB423]|nr:MCE-family protein mce2B [Mycobacterium tuberculosis RGTB423]
MLSVFTVMIIVVFGQVRFHHTTGYSAVFTHVSGLRAGQFVRAAGVEVGKVAKVTLIDGGQASIGGLHRGSLAVTGSGDDRLDPLPQPDRRPVP